MLSEYLRALRVLELREVLPLIPRIGGERRLKILEIGAGAGYQTEAFRSHGYDVVPVDIPQSNYRTDRIVDVIEYNGHQLPFDDDSFDLIYSSNVLEHVEHLALLQKEIARVLRKEGVAIHVLPSAIWRFWTNVTHYLALSKRLCRVFWFRFCRSETKKDSAPKFPDPDSRGQTSPQSTFHLFASNFFPMRHGETGSAVTELYLFSRVGWIRLFKRHGWLIKAVSTNRLFYTGNVVLGARFPMQMRTAASLFLGSACHIFVLKKA